jgi:hypothetical protein
MFAEGVNAASTVASMVPRSLEGNKLTNAVVLDDIKRKLNFLFGLNAVAASTGMSQQRSIDKRSIDIEQTLYFTDELQQHKSQKTQSPTP